MAYGTEVAMPSRMTSSETPRHVVPSLDQLVTQWMSTWGSSPGSAVNSDQVQLRLSPVAMVTEKLHRFVLMLGTTPTCDGRYALSPERAPTVCGRVGSFAPRTPGAGSHRKNHAKRDATVGGGAPHHNARGMRHTGSRHQR
jgi:hypothetical protein